MTLKTNKHLKEVEKILDAWNESEGYLTTNDMHGVDLVAPIDISKLGLDTDDEDEIAELLELHYDGGDYYFRRESDGYDEFTLVASSGEEIFITFEGDLCFPDGDSNSVKLSKENREMEILAYSLDWMHEHGCFCGIYELDYYSNSPIIVKYHEWDEYKALPEDDKKQQQEVSDLIEVIEFCKTLDENTQTIGDIPTKFYEALPEVLQANDGYLEVISVDSFDSHTLSIEFETEDIEGEDRDQIVGLHKKGILTEGEGDLSYKITISTLPNSIRFMKGLHDKLGLTLEVA